MKKLILLLALTLTLSCCNKDDNPPADPLSQLPPATQTGAGTFGCLVNGVPYVDKSGDFNCFYQLVNGEYYFGIRGRKDSFIRQIVIGSEKQIIQADINLLLNSRTDGNFWANVSFDCSNCINANTSNSKPGRITFTKFDLQSNIVSATFEFSVTDPNTGLVYNITNGRFDSFFTE